MDIQRALAGQRRGLLGPDMARRMLETVKPGHSMGFEVGGSKTARYFAKGGDTEGYGAFIVAYGPHGDGAVVMANGAAGPALAEDVVRSIAAAYDWPDFRSKAKTAVPLDKATLTHYAGTYTFSGGRRFIVAVDHGHLAIRSPGEPTGDRLYATSANELFVLTQDLVLEFDGDPHQPRQSGRLVLGSHSLPFRRVAAAQH